jgi:hypothetical protein
LSNKDIIGYHVTIINVRIIFILFSITTLIRKDINELLYPIPFYDIKFAADIPDKIDRSPGMSAAKMLVA